MRISDWSSDVCSSDLVPPPRGNSLTWRKAGRRQAPDRGAAVETAAAALFAGGAQGSAVEIVEHGDRVAHLDGILAVVAILEEDLLDDAVVRHHGVAPGARAEAAATLVRQHAHGAGEVEIGRAPV